MIIFDTNHDVSAHIPGILAAAQASGDGKAIVLRYLSSIAPHGDKVVQPVEAGRLAAAGIRLGLVHEGWGDFAHSGINATAGKRDAVYARQAAAKLGAPAGAGIYFAVDVDTDPSEVRGPVMDYFRVIAAELARPDPDLPLYRLGVYADGAVCEAVRAEFPQALTWLSCAMGWEESRAFLASGKYTLYQKTPRAQFWLDTDPDFANATEHVPVAGDIGDFLPYAPADGALAPGGAAAGTDAGGAAAAAPVAPANPADGLPGDTLIAALQEDLNALGADPKLDVDGLFGGATQGALQAWQRATKRTPAGVPDHQTLTAVRFAAEAAAKAAGAGKVQS